MCSLVVVLPQTFKRKKNLEICCSVVNSVDCLVFVNLLGAKANITSLMSPIKFDDVHVFDGLNKLAYHKYVRF